MQTESSDVKDKNEGQYEAKNEPYLVCLDSFEKVRLRNQEITIGRSKSCDICIHETSISSLHAVIRRDNALTWLLCDKSLNGIFMGNDRLKTDRKLEDGDVFSLGAPIQTAPASFRFQCGSDPAQIKNQNNAKMGNKKIK